MNTILHYLLFYFTYLLSHLQDSNFDEIFFCIRLILDKTDTYLV